MTRARLARLTAFASLSSMLLVGWLVVRHGLLAAAFGRLPADVVAPFNLLTSAALLTTGLFWMLLVWQWRLAGGRGRLSAMTLEQLQTISPVEFEQFVAELFERRGYRVTMRGRSGDKGVDLELVNEQGRRAIVQCKRYRNTVSPEIVRALFGTMLHELAAHGFLVTTAPISEAAREWAANKPITLIDGEDLIAIAYELDSSS